MSLKVFVVLTVGCGRIGFDSTAADAPLGTGPFGPALPLIDLNSATADDDPAIRGDGLELIFDTERTGTVGELFVATRANRTSPWSMPTLLGAVSSPTDDEDAPCLSYDGLVLTFSSERTGITDLWMSTRTSLTSPWGTPVLMTDLNSPQVDERFCMTADKLVGVLTTDRTGERALFETRRSSEAATWETPTPLTELNTSTYNGEAVLDPTGTVIVFASNRSGNSDLWTARRASRDEPFDAPVPLGELNTAGDEWDPSLTADGHIIVFARGARSGTDRELYFAER